MKFVVVLTVAVCLFCLFFYVLLFLSSSLSLLSLSLSLSSLSLSLSSLSSFSSIRQGQHF